jgi:hypothetical protein
VPYEKKEGNMSRERLGQPDIKGPTNRHYRRKIYFVRQLFDAAEPATPEGVALIENSLIIGRNSERMQQGTLPQDLVTYLSSPQPYDRFETQDKSKVFASALIEDTNSFDMVDLVLALRASHHVATSIFSEAVTAAPSRGRVVNRFHDFRDAYLRELAQSVQFGLLLGDEELALSQLYTTLFRDHTDPFEQQDTTRLQSMITDRIIIAELSLNGGLWQKPEGNGASEYSNPASPEELDQLNTQAAETLERLHLLKKYGVTPFEVPGERVRLPWDIAVVPPVDSQDNLAKGVHADGAIADFLFLSPEEDRSDLLFRETLDEGMKVITIGDAQPIMRFRLHDNGQLSHGLLIDNVPSDITERAFIESRAGDAFQRIRGLFIALAFDALVPDEVTTGGDVRGSVARTFRERPQDPPEKRITELLLRRRKSLQRAGVSEKNRQPRGWPAPQERVRGHVRKRPEGTRARPSADNEARAYHEAINVHFDGLKEDETFVKPHIRGTDQAPITYKKARFRSGSATANFTEKLN